MTEQTEIAAALMAELTGRFETLADLASCQQVVSQLDDGIVREIEALTTEASQIIRAVQTLLAVERG